jgi:hypothetical protein
MPASAFSGSAANLFARVSVIETLALPSVVAAAESGNLSIGGIISQVVAGGAGGAILTAIVSAIKNKAAA